MGKGYDPRPVAKKTTETKRKAEHDTASTQPGPPPDFKPGTSDKPSVPSTPTPYRQPTPNGTWFMPPGTYIPATPPHHQLTAPGAQAVPGAGHHHIPEYPVYNKGVALCPPPMLVPVPPQPVFVPAAPLPGRHIPEYKPFDACAVAAAEIPVMKKPQSLKEEREILRLYFIRQIEEGSQLIREGSEMVAQGHQRKVRGYKMKGEAEVVMKCLGLSSDRGSEE